LGFSTTALLVFDFVEFFEKLVFITTALLHFLGKLATLSLLAVALAIFLNEALPILGYGSFLSGAQYAALRELFTKSYTWAAATTIVATTVAIANLRKLDLDSQDFAEKQGERSEKRREAKQAKLDKRPNNSLNQTRWNKPASSNTTPN
jgi:type VI protein secretion system component VasK